MIRTPIVTGSVRARATLFSFYSAQQRNPWHTIQLHPTGWWLFDSARIKTPWRDLTTWHSAGNVQRFFFFLQIARDGNNNKTTVTARYLNFAKIKKWFMGMFEMSIASLQRDMHGISNDTQRVQPIFFSFFKFWKKSFFVSETGMLYDFGVIYLFFLFFGRHCLNWGSSLQITLRQAICPTTKKPLHQKMCKQRAPFQFFFFALDEQNRQVLDWPIREAAARSI